MRVLLLGATGYLGAAVLDRLVADGHEVVAAVRPTSVGRLAAAPGVAVVTADATEPEALAGVLSSHRVDAVVHATAPGDFGADRRVLAAIGAGLARQRRATGRLPALVYTSGVWVLGETGAEPSTEGSTPDPIPLVAGRETVEQAVLGMDGVRGVVIRPGIVHGRGGGIAEMLVGWAREDGVGRYVATTGRPAPVWPMVHADDLADLYVRVLEQESAAGVFHAVAEPGVDVRDLAAAAAVAAGAAPGARAWSLEAAAGVLGRPFAQALALTQRVDAPAARLLGWAPSRPGAVEELRTRPLPRRAGERPMVVGPLPHGQASQTAPVELQEELVRRLAALEGVDVAPSLVSVVGARAFVLRRHLAAGPRSAFQAGFEFAHIHPPHDGSLHLTLPADLARALYDAGWGEPHPVSGTPLLYGPRDPAELEVVTTAVRASYAWARGWSDVAELTERGA